MSMFIKGASNKRGVYAFEYASQIVNGSQNIMVIKTTFNFFSFFLCVKLVYMACTTLRGRGYDAAVVLM